jgi:probable HAF family extracellular repeat protein
MGRVENDLGLIAQYAGKILPWLGIRERHGPNLLDRTRSRGIRGALITTGGCAMYRHLYLALLMILGFLLGGRHVAQAASFTFTPIDVPGASFTQALGINPSGQIVGHYSDSTGTLHGFLYDGGVFTPIDVPGAFFTEAHGINPRGQVVGVYDDSTGGHGFLATPKKK